MYTSVSIDTFHKILRERQDENALNKALINPLGNLDLLEYGL